MKKFIITLMFALAATAFVVAPAAADIKFTSKGYMQIQGMYQSGFPVKNPGYEGSNNWYNMEMVITPTLHINDKVRIHAQIRMMERNYSGTAAGDLYASQANENKYNVWGDSQNNFWLERLYIAFPLLGGNMQIGRRSGGNWANAFGDSDQNRDRILYLRKFGPFTVLGLVEKRDERDGGLAPPRWNNLVNNSFSTVDEDQDAYAIGAVMPFSKAVIIRPIIYSIRDGAGGLLYSAAGADKPSWNHIMMLGGIYKFGPVAFEHEIQYWYGKDKGTSVNYKLRGWGVWAGLGLNLGPLDVDFNGFWLEGGDHTTGTDRTMTLGTGNRFQPMLLMFSEDMGLFYASRGVANGSADPAGSGYVCLYAPVNFKISDDMKVGGAFAYLRADKMLDGTHHSGTGRASKDLGFEIDATFEWRFLDNLKFISTAGWFKPGSYWSDATGLSKQNVWGWRNSLRVEW